MAFVELENGAVARRLVGYGTVEGIETAGIPSPRCPAAFLLASFFKLPFKLTYLCAHVEYLAIRMHQKQVGMLVCGETRRKVRRWVHLRT